MHHVDGNALSGCLDELFAFEATTAQGQCDGCSDVAALGQAMVYGQPMGWVARCRACDHVLLVVVERDGRRTLSMRGLRWLHPAGAS